MPHELHMKGLNSNMVRFQFNGGSQIAECFDVSIPIWYDSNIMDLQGQIKALGLNSNMVRFQCLFALSQLPLYKSQFQYGTIPMDVGLSGTLANDYVSIPIWYDSNE